MADYIEWLRHYVGHAPLFANAVSGIIVNDEGEVLLQLRGGGEKIHSWSLPGGLMEIGERALETLIREIREETDLQIKGGDFLGVYSTPQQVEYPNGDKCHMIAQVFVCRSFSGSVSPDGNETLVLKYFSRSNRPTLFRRHLEQAMQDFEAGKWGQSY